MLQISRRCFAALGATLLLASCALTTDGQAPGAELVESGIVKSGNDQRHYRYVELGNQLRVLLVSDRDTERSAAALDVNVGSRQDPKHYQGLAHFLEHMLFLGTEKYPQAGDYQAFISANGGSHNAYTAFEHTNYFFDINPDQFAPALDRFAQFFIAPLFTESYVEREKNAVHSEYTAKIKDEQRRGADVFKSVINPQHPFAKLSVGTLETLAGDAFAATESSLRDQLIGFYQQYYSANRMTLVLVSPESLDNLEVLAREKFAAVINRNKSHQPISQPLFADNALPMMVTIKPEKALRTLSIAFPTAGVTEHYRQKPLHFLGNILGHEGGGSLLSYLKRQGWSEGLSAGTGLSYQGGATFNITIHLTEAGETHTDQIIKAVFQTINTIRQASQRRELFDEQKALAEQQFRYQQKSASIHYASRLAAGMHSYAREDILRGPYRMTSFDEALVKRFLAFLTPENSLVTLTAPSVSTDQTSYFYQTDYSAKPVDREQLAGWRAVVTNAAIQLPVANPFIASDLSLISATPAGTSAAMLQPRPGLKVWYRPLEQFRSPRGSLFFSVQTPVASDTAVHKASMRLLMAMVSDQLNELSYSATLAGLNYSLRSHLRGFSVKINGFNDKQDLLLAKILQALRQPAFDPERFENIKREKIRRLQNAAKKQPYQLLMGDLATVLYRQSWSDRQLLEAYQTLSLQDVKAFQQSLFTASNIDVLVHGNYHRREAVRFGEQIGEALLSQPAPPARIDIARLPEEVSARQLDSDYEDASLLVYLQAKDLDKMRRAALGVTAQVLRADFYTSLRTEKQLGYIVSSGAYPVMDVPGLFFLVQSPVAGPVQLKQEIDQFLAQRFERLSSVTEADFNQHRNALVARLSEAPQNLLEQSERYWQDIGQGYYQFDFRQQLIAAMQALTYPQWQRYFAEDVTDNNRRLLIYTRGKFTEEPLLPGAPASDLAAFKSRLAFYPFSF